MEEKPDTPKWTTWANPVWACVAILSFVRFIYLFKHDSDSAGGAFVLSVLILVAWGIYLHRTNPKSQDQLAASANNPNEGKSGEATLGCLGGGCLGGLLLGVVVPIVLTVLLPAHDTFEEKVTWIMLGAPLGVVVGAWVGTRLAVERWRRKKK